MLKQLRGIALVLMFSMVIWAARATQSPVVPGSQKPETPNIGSDDKDKAASDRPAVPVAWTTAVDPKPISPSVKKGLDWLVEHQLKDGGWGQGDESQQMGGGADLRDKPNVADTSIAALALIRSGSTPSSGPYKDAVAKAVRYVRSQVESSDSKSLDVSTVKGTRVQGKLGPNIDTFLASLLLAEVKDRMGNPEENKSLELALNKVLGKIKAHQKADGTWDNATGWAPILAQSMAGKGINRAYQSKAKVDGVLLARTEDYANVQFAATSAPASGAVVSADSFGGAALASAPVASPPDAGKPGAPGRAPVVVGTSSPGVAVASTAELGVPGRRIASGGFAGGAGGIGGGSGGFAGGRGSAGVELYDRASSLSVLSDSVNSNKTLEAELKKKVETSKDGKEVAEAKDKLRRIDATKFACAQAQEAIIVRLEDKSFVAGFGSNGGEEFLSYMNIGESLVLKGGPEWKKWDTSMTENLNRIQNDDGSWTGHHCITGRTFCTSTALLVLLGDRTPVPVQAKDKDKDKADVK
jgi:Squalene-hopene cyclase C-terminal domain